MRQISHTLVTKSVPVKVTPLNLTIILMKQSSEWKCSTNDAKEQGKQSLVAETNFEGRMAKFSKLLNFKIQGMPRMNIVFSGTFNAHMIVRIYQVLQLQVKKLRIICIKLDFL